MVGRRQRDRRHQALRGEVLHLLEPLLQLVGRERRAEFLEPNARALDCDRHAGDADVVVARSDLLGRPRALALGDNLVDDPLDQRVVLALRHAFEAQHALRRVLARDLRVRLRQPDHGQKLVELDAVADGVTQRNGLPAACPPDHDPVGREAANRRP